MASRLRFPLVGRYRLLRAISSAPHRRVYLAEDLLREGERCAVKVFSLEEPATLDEAYRVFRTLRSLRHPGVARLYDFGRLDPRELARAEPLGEDGFDAEGSGRSASPWEASAQTEAVGPPADALVYLVSAFYRGLSLRDGFLLLFRGLRAAGGSAEDTAGPADSKARWRIFLEALARIARALDSIHARGLIHCDINSGNLLLIPEPAPTRIERFGVKILDFGLSLRLTTPISTRIRGTLPFLAPEILERSSADCRSDLYSLGLAIAFAVAGRMPFPGSRPKEWLAAARTGNRVSLRALCPQAPEALSRIVDSMLERDPSRRPPDAASLAQVFEEAAGVPPESVRFATRPPPLGWERTLATIRSEIEKAARGEAEIACILAEGAADHFLDRFADEVGFLGKTHGLRVVGGRSNLPREFAYQPFGDMVCQLLQQVDPSEPRFSRFARVLSLLCPSAGRLAGEDLPPLESLRAEVYRTIDLLTEFFLEFAKDFPLLLCLREIQHGGSESLELLRCLVRNVHLRGFGKLPEGTKEGRDRPRILVFATLRAGEPPGDLESEAASSSAQLAELSREPYVLKLRLENLSLEETASWLHERLPAVKVEGETLRRLYEKCAGSVAHLEEFARAVEAAPPAGPRSPGEKDPQAVAHALLALPRKAVKAALERAQRLGAEDRAIMETLGVAGGYARIWLLEAALEEEGSPAKPPGALRSRLRQSLETLEELGLVELRDSLVGAAASLSLPGLADEIARQIPEASRQALHRKIALAGRARHRDDPARVPEDLAFHALQGGLRDCSADLASEAAERLEAARALEPAARLYEKVLEFFEAQASEGVSEPGASATRPRGFSRAYVTERLAGIYKETGHTQRALEKLTVLASEPEIASDPVRLASVYRRLGEVFHRAGDLLNAGYFLQKAVAARAAFPDDRSAPPSQDSQTGSERPALSPRALAEYLEARLSLASFEVARENFSRATENLAEVFRLAPPSSPAISRAYLIQADVQQKQALHDESVRSRECALEAARKDGDRLLLMDTLRAAGSGYSDLGLYDRAVPCFEEAIEIAAAFQSKFDLAGCERSLGTVYHNRADHERALEHFRRSLNLSSQVGDVRGIASSYNNLGLVYRLRDDLAKAAECYRLSIDLFSRLGDQSGMATGMHNLASILELEGKYDEALEYCFRALERRRKTRSKTGSGFSYYGIGRIYQAKGEIDKAISYAEKSLEIRREIGDKLGQAYSTLLLSELALSQERYADSLQLVSQAFDEFVRLGNEVGISIAAATRAQVRAAIGEFEEARRSLEEVLARARRSEQPGLVGSCLLRLGTLAAELGNPEEAEARLLEAERLLRSKRGHRDLVQVLLEQASLCLFTGSLRRAASALEEAYSVLEYLGSRDLVPRYFLLRGRFELGSERPDLESAKNFLERGLVEARESGLRELRAQFQRSLGELEARRGDRALAAVHFEEARAILEELARSLPADLRAKFYRFREREAIRAGSSKSLPAGEQPSRTREARRESAKKPGRATETEPRHLRELVDVYRQTLKLHEVAAAIGSESNLQRLLETVMDAVVELVDAERGFLILKGSKGKGRSIVVARNLDREDIESPERKISGSIARRVLRSGKPVLARNALEDRRFSASKSIRALRVRSFVCVPLRFRGETLGVIYLDNRHRRDAFGESQLDMLQAFADQAAVAVTNARLIEENRGKAAALEKANREMEALNLKLRREIHRRTAELASARNDLRQRQSQLEARYRFHRILGKSEAMQQVFRLLESISPSMMPVLIEGESGTGKDLVARAIHFNSAQRQGRFVSESCGAFTESLFETELFGHVRGAFTGAVSDKKGLLELADGGTLFLDDVDTLSPAMQLKILRVLAAKEVRRVGAKESSPINVRIIVASSRDLEELVRNELFRRDLYYRLNGFRVRLPPLRERKEDIPLLAEHFAAEFSEKSAIEPRRFHPSALRALMEHDWPGNVRELKHLVERTLLVAPGPVVLEEDLVFDPPTASLEASGSGPRSQSQKGYRPPDPEAADSLRSVREAAEREFVLRCLRECGGNVTQAARRCRISRESLYRLLRRYGLQGRFQR